ncbi:hypothetical protein SBP02_06920 [Pseudomonas benzenivorans]|uniref:DUF7079 domain-containing protein n=1 Tax=Pseudomonas benzenivorans TaxID=556533 RepID=A0ABZ0PZ52_9PSED|nr:hypothetical protein [Pseudomonas benzenivorans]WPC06482.1 hypothetical protein SBP02_06920 [Pseudomonas benzenivorans]
MTRDERTRLRSALSDAFVDNEVDYKAIARQLAGFDRSTIELVFFEEVAPVCYSNLQAPIPPIWTAFESTWLNETIESTQEARRISTFRRLRDRAFVVYLRYRLKDEWLSIERELDRQDAADAGR